MDLNNALKNAAQSWRLKAEDHRAAAIEHSARCDELQQQLDDYAGPSETVPSREALRKDLAESRKRHEHEEEEAHFHEHRARLAEDGFYLDRANPDPDAHRSHPGVREEAHRQRRAIWYDPQRYA